MFQGPYERDLVRLNEEKWENVPFPIVLYSFNPLPDNKILDWSKLKRTADDILKCI